MCMTLPALYQCLKRQERKSPEGVRRAEALTRYTLLTRYPGIARPVSEQEYAEAVAVAKEVVRWADEQIRRV